MPFINKWIKENQNKYFCECGCNNTIIIKSHHYSRGIPKYLPGHYRINKPLSEEHKNRISITRIEKKLSIGINNPNYGNKMCDSSKNKISNANKNNKYFLNHKHSIESRNKISKNHANVSGENNPMFGISLSGDKHPNWKGGISFEPYCYKFNNLLKEKIRSRDGRICQECGKTEIENKKKLTVHHIHYDKSNCDPDLITLCQSCNFKVNYNRDYWEDHFMIKLKKLVVI